MELNEHFANGHEVVEDMIVYEICKERLFHCLTCRKLLICEEKNGEVVLKEELPNTLSNKEIATHLTFEEANE